MQPFLTSAQAWRSQPVRPETAKALSAIPPSRSVESAALYSSPAHRLRYGTLELSVTETTTRGNMQISACGWSMDDR
ncbi:uncharacterized protein TrAFT101_000936 [Trichoderma asperellum]|uniref:uncharacterized protein n=1 Tax=Trichoderma asperellum TaxID=101201 RepID=UPI00332AC6F1|nr:hypothetical protein TrAFT101_000936 [Trichoderma asperellum]